MGLLKTTITDELFNQRKAYQYKLSILVGVDSFLYMVYDQNNYILLLKEYVFDSKKLTTSAASEQILSFIEQDRLLKLAAQEVKITYLNQKQTFVPNRLYHPDQKKIYLDQVTALGTSDVIQSDDLSLLRAQNIYAVERTVLNLMQQLFPRAKHYHLNSALYTGYRAQCKPDQDNLFLNVRDQHLQLFFFEKQELVFSNTFKIKTADDLVYYTMLLFQQHNLSEIKQAVNVTGDFEENSDYHRNLSRYVKYIQPLTNSSNYEFHENNRRILETHTFFDLMSIVLCS